MATLRIKDGPKDYFKLHKKILKICGISFNPNEGIAYKLYAISLLFTAILAYPILMTLEIFKHDFDPSSDVVIYQLASTISELLMILCNVSVNPLFYYSCCQGDLFIN